VTIVKAYLFTNGVVMAFDADAKQVPEYQGRGRVVIPKLRRDFPGLIIEGVDWAHRLSEQAGAVARNSEFFRHGLGRAIGGFNEPYTGTCFHRKPPRGCSGHSVSLAGEETRGLILSPRLFQYLNHEAGS
jgi:hypothetical protein